MTRDVLAKALRTFPTITSCCVAGLGEPLLAEELTKVVGYALGALPIVTLITNGRLVPEVDLPYAHFSQINVSANACTPTEYAQRCGVDGFQGMLAGLGKLLDLGANVGVSFVVGRSNAEQVPAMLQWSAGMGVRFVALVNTLPCAVAESAQPQPGYWDEVLPLDPEHEALLDDWQHDAIALGLDVTAWPVLVGPPAVLESAPRRCESPSRTLGVDGDGNVTGCQRILAPSPSYGNVFADGERCYQGRHFTLLREQAASGDGICGACFGSWAAPA